MKIPPKVDEDLLKGLDYAEAMVAAAWDAAEDFAEEYEITKIAAEKPELVEPSGARFVIPLAIPEEHLSGDERAFKRGALSSRLLPLPLMWQVKTASGHDGSVVVGRIDYIERVENGLGNARGVFDVGPWGREAERMVRGGFLRGVSADLDKFKANKESGDDSELAEKSDIENDKIVVTKARLMGITIVAKPAFEECFIMIEEEPTIEVSSAPIEDGIYEEETVMDYEEEIAALAASAAPEVPPRSWFKDPGLKEPTPLTITDDGRVYGHIAAWKTSHIGLGRGVKPPRSATNYAYFCTGALRTDEGDVRVGQLTLAGGHASLSASAKDAVKHYDDTASAVADVTAGEDAHGIWVAGSLRPDATASQVRAFRASAPSGDWRPIDGRLELVAVCQVNVPGFPIARAMTAGGAPQAIVAAGAAYLAELREQSKISELDKRLKSVEMEAFSTRAEASRARMAAVMQSRNEELALRASAAREKMNLKKANEEAELSAKMEALKARFSSR